MWQTSGASSVEISTPLVADLILIVGVALIVANDSGRDRHIA